MANSVINFKSNDSRLESRIIWSSSSNGSQANTSTVNAQLQAHRTDSYTTKGTWTGSLTIAGTTESFSISVGLSSEWFTFKTFPITQKHNDDGTGKCFISGNISAPSGTSMAGASASGSEEVTLDKIPRYLTITSFKVQSKTINTAVISWATSDPRSSTHYSLNGGEWIGSATHGENVASDQKSGTFNIKNLSPNTTYKLKIDCIRSDSGLTTVSNEISFTTYDYAKLSSVPNVNIGSSHKITWTNPSGASISLKLCKTDNTQIIDYGTVTGTNKTITPTASTIYALTPNSNTYKARYILTTTQNGKTYTNPKDFDFKVTNSNPIFSNFEYQDNNSTTIALTGNNKKLIRYYSGVKAIISTTNKAVAQNSATMKLYRLIVGDKQSEKAFSSTQAVELNVYNIENSIINVYAIDSRTNTTNKQISPLNFILYNKITINAVSAERGSGGIGKNVTLRYNGTFWNSNFGVKNNSITSIKYYYRLAGTTSSWTLGGTVLSPTISGNSFSQSVNIQGDLAGEGFSQDNSFDIKLVVYDELMKTEQSNNTFIYTLGAGTPLLAYHKEGLAIGQKYDTSVNAKLQVAGNLVASKIKGLNLNSYFSGMKKTACWYYIGNFVFGGQGSFAVIDCYMGDGQNGKANQNTHAKILLKQGWEGNTLPIGVTTNFTQNYSSSIKVAISHVSETECKLYIYLPFSYNDLTYIVNGSYKLFTPSNTVLSAEPTTDKESTYYWTAARYVTTLTAKGHTNYGTNGNYLPDMNFLSFWNGAFNSSNASNLTYCYQGTIQAKPTSLYDNSNGSNGTITLSQTAANFSYLEIYFNDSVYKLNAYVKVCSPNNKIVALDVGHTFSSSGTRIVASRKVKISGTSISNASSDGDDYGVFNSWNNSIDKANKISIIKVLGYK